MFSSSSFLSYDVSICEKDGREKIEPIRASRCLSLTRRFPSRRQTYNVQTMAIKPPQSLLYCRRPLLLIRFQVRITNGGKLWWWYPFKSTAVFPIKSDACLLIYRAPKHPHHSLRERKKEKKIEDIRARLSFPPE